MAIPKSITAEHVKTAIERLRAGVEHGFGASLGYDVLYNGERFPPKAVVGLAAEIATGRRLSHREFSGGESNGATNPLLRSLGFQIVGKDGQSVVGPSGGPKSEHDRVWERLSFGSNEPVVRMEYADVAFDVEVTNTGRLVRVDDELRDALARVDEATLLAHLDDDARKTWEDSKATIQNEDRVTLWRAGTVLMALRNPKRKTVNLNPYVTLKFDMDSLLGCLSAEDAELAAEPGKPLSVRGLADVLGVNDPGPPEPVGALLQELLERYGEFSPGEGFGADHPLWELKTRLEHALSSLASVKARPTLRAAFAGVGRLARDPWVALFDSRVTTSVRRGNYVVYLFKRDLTGVYLTLNQGVTDVFEANPSAEAARILRARAAATRAKVRTLEQAGFMLNGEIELAPDEWGKRYESSTIAHKFYAAGAVPPEHEVVADLDAALKAYDALIKEHAKAPAWWMFQSNAEYYDLRRALATGEYPRNWLVKQHAKAIHEGDRVFLWETGGTGVLAVATLTGEPGSMEEEDPFVRSKDKIGGNQLRVPMRVDQVLAMPISRDTVKAAEGLGDLTILNAPQGTNFSLTAEQADVLLGLISPPRNLSEACVTFSKALREARLSFGERHERLVRSFLASIVTKSFVILTGLSGSGKTQIALRFGQWLGDGRHKVVPVRPDWTGPESLLGYENALRQPVDGKTPWTVPEPLRFMLQARDGAGVPHLLLLDEMNLAHVERYFADVLSGMESRQPCLPNLTQRGGDWLPEDEKSRTQVPRNLFIVGTINIDETTYMFSPKVLDRANTIEFRVTTADLPTDLEDMAPPQDIEVADPPLTKVLLDVASDPLWHTDPDRQPDWLEDFAGHLRELHTVLSRHGFEFGHRVFSEAVRFAVIYAAMDDDTGAEEDIWEALDLQVMQKMLPRVHGARRRLEPLLRELGAYAAYGEHRDDAGAFDPMVALSVDPKMPVSFDKIRRMTLSVRANQFASFTE